MTTEKRTLRKCVLYSTFGPLKFSLCFIAVLMWKKIVIIDMLIRKLKGKKKRELKYPMPLLL